ncbi:MAG TPA: PhoH family protein [Candidatus Blautia gallistercoris]|uniref:PhoH family protein n=1 Tax=Candidatus Blautia gallistercoris TaxID=2838490 RepID=A0A9D2B474_9FIRM|nr:PhoH family protein [Candidatus Blautia gallistercoris]
MVKTYVIDTNVLIQAPYALQCFEENQVVLPLVVLEELDGLKKADGERGANARRAIRFLEKLRERGDLLQGVLLEEGGSLRVETNYVNVVLPDCLPEDKADNRILKVCRGLMEKDTPIVLVTKDLVLRMKAQILGIEAQDFSTEQVIAGDEQYSGRIQCYVPEERFKEFKKKGISLGELYQSDDEGNPIPFQLVENQFVILKADQSVRKTHLGRVSGQKVVPLEFKKASPYGIKPRNAGQYFLQEALMKSAQEAPLVIVKGMAGTAKTFYSLAVGLEKLLNNPTGEYRRILICRPNAQFDEEIGFLPGDEQEKISPLMRPIIDNLEQLIDSNEEERYKDEQELQGKIEEIFARGLIQTEAMNFIRGRSFVKTYLIIDEAQNMTPNQIKGIITRAGKGTKIILLGDPNQIDRPFLNERTNGLSYASEKMKGSPLCYQITMTAEECERSELALDAIGRL